MKNESFVLRIFHLFDDDQREMQRKFSNIEIFEFYEYQNK
jgi:hypothetical protein